MTHNQSLKKFWFGYFKELDSFMCIHLSYYRGKENSDFHMKQLIGVDFFLLNCVRQNLADLVWTRE